MLAASGDEELDSEKSKSIIKEFADSKPDAWKRLMIDLEPMQCPQLCDLFVQLAGKCLIEGKKRCKRILPGGNLHKIFTDSEFGKPFAKMPATNDDSESAFGVIKQILKSNPHMKYDTGSVLARLKINKTFDFYDLLKKQDPSKFFEIINNCSEGQTQLLRKKKLKVQENLENRGKTVTAKIQKNFQKKQKVINSLPNEIKSLNSFEEKLLEFQNFPKRKKRTQLRAFYLDQKRIHQYLYPTVTFNTHKATPLGTKGAPPFLPVDELKKNFISTITNKYRKIDFSNIQENDAKEILHVELDQVENCRIAQVVWDVIDPQNGQFLETYIAEESISHTAAYNNFIALT